MLTLWADLHREHPLSQALSIPSHAAALALGVICAQTTGAAQVNTPSDRSADVYALDVNYM
jgi:hypothetical protein